MLPDPATQQFSDCMKQISVVKNAYCDGSKATLKQISCFGALQTSSNNEVENINKHKNRLARECADYGRHKSNFFFIKATCKWNF